MFRNAKLNPVNSGNYYFHKEQQLQSDHTGSDFEKHTGITETEKRNLVRWNSFLILWCVNQIKIKFQQDYN